MLHNQFWWCDLSKTNVDVYKFLMLHLKENFCSILLNFSAAKCSSSGYSLVCDKVRTRYKFVKSKNLAYHDLDIAHHAVTMNQYSGTLISLHCLYGPASISDILRNLNWLLCEPEAYCSIGLKLHEFNFELLTLISLESCITAGLASAILFLLPLACEGIIWESLGPKSLGWFGVTRCPLQGDAFPLRAIWHEYASAFLLDIHFRSLSASTCWQTLNRGERKLINDLKREVRKKESVLHLVAFLKKKKSYG